jgi:hypothetical protein
MNEQIRDADTKPVPNLIMDLYGLVHRYGLEFWSSVSRGTGR